MAKIRFLQEHGWRADGTATNSGWDEQGSTPGVYENGNPVLFTDTDCHGGSTSPHRVVEINELVAPGSIIINAATADGTNGGGSAEMKFGYAFVGATSSSGITDYTDADGNLLMRTALVNQGSTMLVLNTHNSFTGGVTMENGALYLGCAHAAGSGPITLYNDSSWTEYRDSDSGTGSFSSIARTGTELIVNYNSSSTGYRTPTLDNAIIIRSHGNSVATPQVAISFGTASYGEEVIPSQWRNVTITGGVYGDGDLYLKGYTFANREDTNNVSAFTINKSNASSAALPADAPTAFTGTVHLLNWFNSALVDESSLPITYTGGADTADMHVSVVGTDAAIQFTDGASQQFLNSVSLENGAHVLVGGTLKSDNTGLEHVDTTGAALDITTRTAATASLSPLSVVQDSDVGSVSIGGTDAAPAQLSNVQVSTMGDCSQLAVHDATLQGSLVQLHESASLDMTNAVLIHADSAIVGSAGAAVAMMSARQINQVSNIAALQTDPAEAAETVTVSSATTVQLTAAANRTMYSYNGFDFYHVTTNQFQNVNVTGQGLSLILADGVWAQAYAAGAEYLVIQIGGESGRFLFEEANSFGATVGNDSAFTLTDNAGRRLSADWLSSATVSAAVGAQVSEYMLYVAVPEPTAATLSLLALAALAARRRRTAG